jgi:uncharacterized protein YcfL
MQQKRGLSMKKYFVFFILIFFFISCDTNPTSSENDEPELSVVIENLVGRWNWTESIDSTGQVVDESTLNNTRTIEITQDRTFKQYRNDTLVFYDKFNLLKTTLPNKTDTVTVLDWNTSKYFNYVIYSLKSKYLIIGITISNIKSKYARIN